MTIPEAACYCSMTRDMLDYYRRLLRMVPSGKGRRNVDVSIAQCQQLMRARERALESRGKDGILAHEAGLTLKTVRRYQHQMGLDTLTPSALVHIVAYRQRLRDEAMSRRRLIREQNREHKRQVRNANNLARYHRKKLEAWKPGVAIACCGAEHHVTVPPFVCPQCQRVWLTASVSVAD